MTTQILKKDADTLFSEFLDQEYEQIAQAHFKTLETISTFFKNYLVIMGIPVALIGYLFTQKKGDAPIDLTNFMSLGGILFIVISLAGGAVLIYIINLRMDAVLYARTVNGIRKYFYDKAKIDISRKLRMRTLPQTTSLPGFYEGRFFIPVIFAFALLNTTYFYFGLVFLSFSKIEFSIPYVFSSFLFIVIHFLVYLSYANYRETGYLKSHVIGVDIDGVLNKHREHFCELLQMKTGKKLQPENIKHIPVHEEANLGISRDDEKKVFNDPSYWIEMPVQENTSENFKKLRNELNFKVILFTNRPWPKVDDSNIMEKESIYSKWNDVVSGLNFRRNRPIDRITRWWLKTYSIEYDELVIESIDEDSRGKYKFNRFTRAMKDKMKFFIEDDAEKAEKLAYICDVVFLFKHPYNELRKDLPSNVIFVESWNEIYMSIRKLS